MRHPLTVEILDSGLHGSYFPPHDVHYVIVVNDAEFYDNLAHELVHYEQWRDGRKLTERGVPQRAGAIVRRWKQEQKRAA